MNSRVKSTEFHQHAVKLGHAGTKPDYITQSKKVYTDSFDKLTAVTPNLRVSNFTLGHKLSESQRFLPLTNIQPIITQIP